MKSLHKFLHKGNKGNEVTKTSLMHQYKRLTHNKSTRVLTGTNTDKWYKDILNFYTRCNKYVVSTYSWSDVATVDIILSRCAYDIRRLVPFTDNNNLIDINLDSSNHLMIHIIMFDYQQNMSIIGAMF